MKEDQEKVKLEVTKKQARQIRNRAKMNKTESEASLSHAKNQDARNSEIEQCIEKIRDCNEIIEEINKKVGET